MASLIATKIVLRSNHTKMIEESRMRNQRMAEFEMQQLKAMEVHKDMSDHIEKQNLSKQHKHELVFDQSI